MKKICVLMMAMLLSVGVAMAKSELKVTSGNASLLKQDAKAVVIFDYANTKVGDKTLNEYLQSRGADFVKDWPQDSQKAVDYFAVFLNTKHKNGKGITVGTEDVSKYKMIFHVADLDMGNGGGMFIPFASAKAGGVIVNGTLELIEIATGKTVLTVDAHDVKGTSHVSETVRLGLAYGELAKMVAKLK
ncbi:MAG: hypothetical protein J6Y99_12380 [Bacteroidales bacterium]|nr:hypothetical protein [Bacteroidales bacterium]